MAAGILLVSEAGGRCSDMHGEPARLRGPHLLADNGAVHEGMLKVFAEVFRHEYRYGLPVIE
jgi:myo-inositol-1(or 4)-monophosphatase